MSTAVRRAEGLDQAGEYVRRGVPESALIPGRTPHRPWLRPEAKGRGCPPPLGSGETAERPKAVRP